MSLSIGGGTPDDNTARIAGKVEYTSTWHINRALAALPDTLLLATPEGREEYGVLVEGTFWAYLMLCIVFVSHTSR